jgi:hypothetical protein
MLKHNLSLKRNGWSTVFSETEKRQSPHKAGLAPCAGLSKKAAWQRPPFGPVERSGETVLIVCRGLIGAERATLRSNSPKPTKA